MSQHPSPWRVNDAVLYDALRDEFRSSLAAALTSADRPGNDVSGVIQQLRAEMYGVDGFDRLEVGTGLDATRSRAGSVHSRG